MSDYISKSRLVETLTRYKFGAIGSKAERECTKDTILLFVNSQPTVDEKEIIRKPMERIIERLEEKLNNTYLQTHLYKHFVEGEQYALDEAIEIVKEEGGIE